MKKKARCIELYDAGVYIVTGDDDYYEAEPFGIDRGFITLRGEDIGELAQFFGIDYSTITEIELGKKVTKHLGDMEFNIRRQLSGEVPKNLKEIHVEVVSSHLLNIILVYSQGNSHPNFAISITYSGSFSIVWDLEG